MNIGNIKILKSNYKRKYSDSTTIKKSLGKCYVSIGCVCAIGFSYDMLSRTNTSWCKSDGELVVNTLAEVAEGITLGMIWPLGIAIHVRRYMNKRARE